MELIASPTDFRVAQRFDAVGRLRARDVVERIGERCGIRKRAPSMRPNRYPSATLASRAPRRPVEATVAGGAGLIALSASRARVGEA